MNLNLKCKKCGFGFSAVIPDDETEENIKAIKACPCGCMMEEVSEIPEIHIQSNENRFSNELLNLWITADLEDIIDMS